MKKLSLLLLLFIFQHAAVFACEVCKKQQPKLLQGISHGAGPQSNWDYVIVWAAVIIVIATLFYSIKWLIRPGEDNTDHIKRTILN